MARLSRLIVAEQLHFVWQRGLASPTLFVDAQDHATYLALLTRWARVHKVDVHAYVLLPHDIYLLVTPHVLSSSSSTPALAPSLAAAPALLGASSALPAPDATPPEQRCGLSLLMQALGRDHVAAYNRRHGRTGTLWHGRFRVGPVDAARDWLACVQYIEQAPVRQGLAPTAAGYTWSSAPHHLGQARSELLVEHPKRWAMGNTPFEREARHREAIAEPLPLADAARIEASVLKGWALGPPAFIEAVQRQAGQRRVQPASRGRPRKTR